MSVDLPSVMILLALQLGLFAWRVAREIERGTPHPFPYVPVPDNVNVGAMLAVLWFCVLAPLTAVGSRTYPVAVMSTAVFAAALVLVVAHPLVVASHYRVWRGGRTTETERVYCTLQEAVVQLVALIAAAAVFLLVLRAAEASTIVLTPR